MYNRDTCPDMVGELLIPLLNSSVKYDRTTYTFSSLALSIAAAGIAGLVRNGGAMRLICHHQLPKNIVDAIMNGQRSAEKRY